MKIRRFHEGDTEGIVRLIDDVMAEFGENFDSDLDRDLLDIPKYYGNKGGYWVLEDEEGRIVGTIAMSRVSDEICKFRRFYIHKDYRGQGWGSKLFEYRIKEAREFGYKQAWMVTSPNHKAAIEFLKKKGAQYSEERLFPTRRAHMFFTYDL